MSFREQIIAVQQAKANANKICSEAYNKLVDANLYNDSWYDYAWQNDVSDWPSYRFGRGNFSYNKYIPRANEVTIEAIDTWRCNSEYQDITLSYEEMDDLDNFIKRKKQEALYKVRELQILRREKKERLKLAQIAFEKEQLAELKAKYES